METAAAARSKALRDLRWHWSEAYDIDVTGAGWTAKRLDNGRVLVAGTPRKLRSFIVADYATEAVQRGLREGQL
jgi:hypothetical protein